MFDCHLHSSFSGDSEMNAVSACGKAVSLGLEGIIFTDHLDYGYPNYDVSFNIDFDSYSKFMDKLKSEFMGKIKVLKGIEIGIQPHVIEKTRQLVDSYNFDFVIGSIHIIDGMDPYYKDYFKGKSKRQAYMRYLEEILFMVNNYTNYDVVGHIGYLRRYGDYDDRSLKYVDYKEIIDEILKKVLYLGKGIEVNTSGYKGILDSPIPDFDIIKRYKELGGEIISVGSDAHSLEYVGLNFKYVYEKLKELGFKYTTHFENRKPIFDKL